MNNALHEKNCHENCQNIELLWWCCSADASPQGGKKQVLVKWVCREEYSNACGEKYFHAPRETVEKNVNLLREIELLTPESSTAQLHRYTLSEERSYQRGVRNGVAGVPHQVTFERDTIVVNSFMSP